MKKCILIIVVLFAASSLFAGNINKDKKKSSTALVLGKVIDKVTGEEIAGAEIKIDNKIIYTDLNGNFTVSIPVDKTDAVVKFISYNDAKVKINPFAYNKIEIQLESK